LVAAALGVEENAAAIGTKMAAGRIAVFDMS
jgi:hypothetical protein